MHRYWRDLSIRLPTEVFTAVAVDPGDPEILLAGADGFVFKSDDGGESWRPVLSFPRGLAVLDAELALTDLDDDAEGSGRQASRRAQGLLDDAESLMDRADAERTRLEDEAGTELVPDVEIGAVAEDLMAEAAAAAANMPAGDAEPLSPGLPRQGPGVREIAFLGSDQRTVYVATARGLFRSADSGERFSRLEVPGGVFANDVRDVAIDPLRPSSIYLGTAAGLLLSKDGGLTFVRATDRLGFTPTLSVEAASVEDEALVLVGTEAGLFRSWDGGETFREMMLRGLSPFEPVFALAYDARGHITYAGTQRGLYAGERKAALLEARAATEGLFVLSLSVDPTRPRGLAVGLRERGLFQSEDTGLSEADLGNPLPANAAAALARPADDPDALVVATERGVFRLDRGTGITVSLDRMRALERRWSREPTLEEAGLAALAHARLEPWAYEGVRQRARFAALAPVLQARYRFLEGRPNRVERSLVLDDTDALEAADTDANANAIEELLDDGDIDLLPDTGTRHEVFVFATWDLDRVVFTPWEIGHARLRPELVRAEQRIVGRVRSLFSARRRLEAQLYLEGERESPRDYAAKLLRLAELTSHLDALCGGAFVQTAVARGAELVERPLLEASFDPAFPPLRGAP